MRERQTQILDILSHKKQITVLELAQALQVSDVTIRKDLSVLEDKGLLKREHGFATLPESDDINTRLLFNYDTKRRIARKALESLKDGETVMIESGSCCALLAEEMALSKRRITIITNSIFIATFLRDKPSVRIILLGGEFQSQAQVVVGPLVKKSVQDFFVDKFFVGTDGFNEIGSMGGDLMRTQAVRDMAESAQRAIILTESKKFSQTGVVPLLAYSELDSIYTDDKISSEWQQKIESKGVRIISVKTPSATKNSDTDNVSE